MNEILPYYWKAKKIIVDDNKTFLEAVESRINPDSNVEFSTMAISVLEKLTKQVYSFDYYQDDNCKDKYSVNYSTAIMIANDPMRHEIYSTLVVDNDMPEISGLELCKKLSAKSGIRKIMLTGNLDYKSGVSEMNHKVVDSFLSKDDLSGAIINELIDREEKLFFYNHTKTILDYLRKEDPNYIIFSSGYKSFFNQIIESHKIVEYYLFDPKGRFILFDSKGNKKHLFLFSEDDLSEMYEQAQYRLLDEKLCEDIKIRKKALCYYKEKEEGLPLSREWGNYIHKINEIIIDGDIFYFAVTCA